MEKHRDNGCFALAGERYKMPKEGEQVKFKHMYNKFKVPFVIYLDFEAAPIPYHYVPGLNEKTVKTANHEVVSYCLNVVSSVPGITFKPILYRGFNAVEDLFDMLKTLESHMLKHFYAKKPLNWNDEVQTIHNNSTHCIFCEGELLGDKVRDHCHMTGNYRGAAHRECNKLYNNRAIRSPRSVTTSRATTVTSSSAKPTNTKQRKSHA